ncbi:hypothetical protein TI04_07995 [Achromatium sp. WMS2]|nr:hypothetical protein TI04_07995 [Achromatium sp. WMS2]
MPNADDEKYDLLLFGSDLQGPALDEALKKLARMLVNTTPEQVRGFLSAAGGKIIGKELSKAAAQQALKKLVDIGFKANMRPSKVASSWTLERVVRVEVCPACGHKHELEPTDAMPENCSNPASSLASIASMRVSMY